MLMAVAACWSALVSCWVSVGCSAHALLMQQLPLLMPAAVAGGSCFAKTNHQPGTCGAILVVRTQCKATVDSCSCHGWQPVLQLLLPPLLQQCRSCWLPLSHAWQVLGSCRGACCAVVTSVYQKQQMCDRSDNSMQGFVMHIASHTLCAFV